MNNYYPQKTDANVDANNLSAASADADMNANIKTMYMRMQILGTSLIHPISLKTPAIQYQPIDRKKRREKKEKIRMDRAS